jgi:uncharacterized damage-inducible protein DinB
MFTLAGRFDYDRWANRLWADSLDEYRREGLLARFFRTAVNVRMEGLQAWDASSLERQLLHLLGVQGIWLMRLGQTDVPPPPDFSTGPETIALIRSELSRIHSLWQETIRNYHPETVFFVADGKTHANLPLGDIACHVLEKSASYRGKMAQMAEDHGLPAPETGFLHYKAATGIGKLPA